MKRNLLLGTALACFALLLAAESAQAQLRGRGGRAFGYGPSSYGGYGGYSGYGSYPGGYGYGNYGYSPYSSGNWGSGWNNYGYGPGYSNWNQNYTWGQNTWNGQPYANYNYNTPGYSSSGAPVTYDGYGAQQGASFSGQQQGNNEAMLHVMVPAPDARVTLDGHETQQRGMERTFLTPPLQEGNYTYKIRAS